ncbi:MAG: BamA/TamA family outer membrane protein [Gemmatimonadales bacterium]
MTTAPRFTTLAVALLLLAPAAQAQYFGRNKVQYESFDFKVLTTEHFRIYFYPEEREAAESAARMAERWYARLSTLLAHQLRGKQALVLYADHPDFEQTNVISDQPSEATGGVTESLKRRIILPLGASLAETDHVLGHELVHAFQYDITGQGGGGSSLVPGITRLPLWFVEGMAEYLSLGHEDPHTAMWMRDAVRRDKLPSLSDLAGYDYFPYRYGQAFWAYLGGTFGDDILGRALRLGGKGGDVRIALQQVTGRNADTLVAAWHRALRAAAEDVSRATDSVPPASRLLRGGEGSTQLNLAPALSPDGTRLVYFSEASLFTIDLYLADVETGRTIRRLLSQRRDPHFESLQFLNSAGAWDATGRRFAFGGVAKGKPVLVVLDGESGRVEREIALPELGEIFNPTWAPDGRRIAFSAQVGGFTDLFVYHLEERRLRRLTEDAFADLQPAWSPDGEQIAFVTDRFGTSPSALTYDHYRLALMDAGSGRIRALPSLGDAKHINPQWSPDGRSLYFLSDRGGITNVYRLALADGEFSQVTDLYTGVSGITALSPALSVAQRSGDAVFGVYSGDGYELHVTGDRAMLAGGPLRAIPAVAAALPPTDRTGETTVAALLANPRLGLPPDTGFAAAPYRAGFSIDFIAQPSLAVAADRFGTYIGGGATLYWSDMLGDHNLITMAQVSGSTDFLNVAALLGYENRKSRWNWGAVVQQIPFLQGFLYFDQVAGEDVFVEEVFRQTNRQAVGFVAYPLSRVRRVEFQAGALNSSFDRRKRAFSLFTGQQVYDSTVSSPFGDMNLGLGTVAMVFDNSFFGATGPLVGERYRLEASPVFGTLDFTTALADYRRYIMPVRPFTLAGRVLHVGRYGPNADDGRIFPLYLGYPSLVRGYDFGSFEVNECPSTARTIFDCPVIAQLFGSKMLVGNVELRFPLFGLLGLGDGYYGILPVDAALFYDAGLAWTDTQGAQLFGDGPRRFVTSAGATLRMNLFGYAIGQLDYVRPLQRPERDWMLRLSLTPGF